MRHYICQVTESQELGPQLSEHEIDNPMEQMVDFIKIDLISKNSHKMTDSEVIEIETNSES